MNRPTHNFPAWTLSCLLYFGSASPFCAAAAPSPVLETVFPAGGTSGQTVTLKLSGSHLQNLTTLHSNIPKAVFRRNTESTGELTIPPDTPPGVYDLWAVCENGVSGPRTFSVSSHPEQIEVEPNDSFSTQTDSVLAAGQRSTVINGCIETPGDHDCFRVSATRGQRLIVECMAERIDSRLRAVIDVLNSDGRQLAVNRGYYRTDPLLDFTIPTDGEYYVRVQDLISGGSPEYVYRLELNTGPKVAFAWPSVIQRNTQSTVELFGWNFHETGNSSDTPASTDTPVAPAQSLQRLSVTIPAEAAHPQPIITQQRSPSQIVQQSCPVKLPGSADICCVGISDLPVLVDSSTNHSPKDALPVTVPCEISGQLAAIREQDWYSVRAHRGEVLCIDSFADRMNSPVDPDVIVWNETGNIELAQFSDATENPGGTRLPLGHADAAGRWTAPADGTYLISIRNLSGGSAYDPRRIYRMRLQREVPHVDLVAIPRSDQATGLNIAPGGSAVLDLFAVRSPGLNGPIQVSSDDLPAGLKCPDVWLGPGVSHTTVSVSAGDSAATGLTELRLQGRAVVSGSSQPVLSTVHGASVVRNGTPNGWSRLTSSIPMMVTGSSAVRIEADGHEELQHHLYGKLRVRHSPGGILDVAVQVHRSNDQHQAAVRLIGDGLPVAITNQTSVIPAGRSKGYLSFYLPETLLPGTYSLVVRATTTVPAPEGKADEITIHSNPVVFEVTPPAFHLEVDPFATHTAHRGETIQVAYRAARRNGFIGKMHTELAVPGVITDIPGLRGRGETFTGQTEQGSLQIVVNPDAPLGRQQFLRLFTVGVIEDEPTWFGSSFLDLEIVE
jgi:hypothetical protein